MRLDSGTTIADVTLTRRLGSGGQGEVWAGRRPDGSEVALKVLTKGDSHAMLRAMREARLQGQIQHPHIVRIHEFAIHDGVPVITSELVDGLSLRQLLRRGPIDPELLDRLAHQMFAGVEAAHAKGLVHRDLKPGNVLLTWEDGGYQAKITDFGIAVEASPFSPGDDLSGRGLAVGTAGFMAPEQHQGRELVDARADLFGLGAVLYWMAAGRRAFSGSSWQEVVDRSCAGRFTPVTVLAPDLPERWALAIHWALDPSPRRRPADVATLRRAWDGMARFPDWVVRGVDDDKPEPTASDDITEVNTPALPDQTDASLAISFGRHKETEAVRKLMKRHRVVTLRGAPGIGKTHLATRVAASRAADGSDWVQCYLTEARTESGLLVALSAGLGLPFAGEDPVERIALAIEGRGDTTVVLDNAEQVLDPLLAILPRLVLAAPEARFLVTSRRRLDVASEAVYDVGPLDTPNARALFQDRARRRQPNLQFSPEEQAQISELIERLEANPLALELAASRVVEDGIGELLEALRAGAQDKAMQVALEWSWRLLAPWERHVLGCCSVFRGGLFPEALEAMIDLSPWPIAPDAMQVIHRLVDHSLIAIRTLGEDTQRLHPYASVRTFVHDKLHPTEREAAERAHLAWFAALSGPEGEKLRKGPAGAEATLRMIADNENVVHALDTAIRLGEPAQAVLCAAGIGEVLSRVGPPQAGIRKIEQALAMDGHTAAGRAQLYITLGQLLVNTNQYGPCVSALKTAEALAADAGDATLEAEALTRLGMVAHHRGQPLEAEAHYERALELLTEDSPPWRRALVHRQLCAVQQHMGAFEAADRSIHTALALLEEAGNVTDVPLCHIHVGTLRAHQGRPEEASVYERLALRASRRMGDTVQEGRVLGNLGVRLHQIGDRRGAERAFRRAAWIARRTGSIGHEAIARGNLGETLMVVGRTAESEEELTRAIAIGDKTWPVVAGTFRTTLARLYAREGRLDEAQELLDEAQPMLRGVHRTNHAALLLARAEISARRGDPDGVHRWIRQAEVAYGGSDLSHDPELALRLIEVMALTDQAAPGGENLR